MEQTTSEQIKADIDELTVYLERADWEQMKVTAKDELRKAIMSYDINLYIYGRAVSKLKALGEEITDKETGATLRDKKG